MTCSMRMPAIVLCTVSRPERVHSTGNCPIEVLRLKIWGCGRGRRISDASQTSRRSIVVWGRLRDKAKQRWPSFMSASGRRALAIVRPDVAGL
jgi:hypothetical protein